MSAAMAWRIRRGPASVPPFQGFLEANRADRLPVPDRGGGPAATRTTASRRRSCRRCGPIRALTDGAKLDRWILPIASRKAIDHHRAGAVAPPRPTTVPERAVHRRGRPIDGDDPLWEAVRALPPRQRVAVVHRHVLDRSYPEIAELMGGTEETARANVYQGTKRLRELMA